MARRVLIMGAGGQLGRKVGEVFGARQWLTLGADTSIHQAPVLRAIPVASGVPPEVQSQALLAHLQEILGNEKLDAVVNVAGGFAMGSAAEPEVVARTRAMVESSLYTSVLAARAAAVHLRPGGLLVLPGACAALGPTGWSLPYGAAKAAVHHLVRSLADAESAGMPAGAKTIGLAPQTLDTAQNREAMPDADRGSWATLEEVAEQLAAWCADPAAVESGKVYVVRKAGGLPATFESQLPL